MCIRDSCRSVSCGALNGLHIAAGDHQLVGGTGVTQTVEHDTRELRVCILPFEELLADEHRLHRQTVGQTEQHTAVMVAVSYTHLDVYKRQVHAYPEHIGPVCMTIAVYPDREVHITITDKGLSLIHI